MQSFTTCMVLIAAACSLLLWLRARAQAQATRSELDGVERSRRLLLEAIEATPCSFAVFCPQGELLAWNSSYQALHEPAFSQLPRPIRYEDLMREAARRSLPAEAVDADVAMRVHRHFSGPDSDFERLYPNGTWLRASKRRLAGGEMAGFGIDVTELKRTEARLRELQARAEHLARHDPLTGLANRILFHERLGQAVVGLGRGQLFAVLLLDLDGFKVVNDTLGHGAGDLLLAEVAARLSGCVREVDLVARLGGDEFAVIQAGTAAPSDAALLARRAADALAPAFLVHGQEASIGVSIGIVLAPEDGTDAGTLLHRADVALYQAKADGRGACRFHEPETDSPCPPRDRQGVGKDEVPPSGRDGLPGAPHGVHPRLAA